ncbi:hypothetical protein C8T65DRAFT_739883 [Cerioporus squamosus]|nr:hypothetical protein C8T65DRAFT_741347 [Cerioporus squamosus]KAI0709709.1 hypothetical protein C8T65DRAFT_739883 [Cerioporus squamosus]
MTLTLDEKKHLLESNGCFYCRKPAAGHIARNYALMSSNPTPAAMTNPLKTFTDMINQVKT